MSFTVFLGNLPTWVTKDDIQAWLRAENLVADEVKVIRNPETQESKGFAFIDAPNAEEMDSIIRRAVTAGGVLTATIPAVLALYFVHKYGVSVPFWDEWNDVPLLDASYRAIPPLSALFEQHNEHRIFLPRGSLPIDCKTSCCI